MTPSPLCIGVDAGTGSAKAIAIDASGQVVASESIECSFESPQPGWAEADPEVWWRASCDALRRVMSHPAVTDRAIASVGLTGQMHGLVLVDGDSEVVRPAIMWNDQRTASEVEEAERVISRETILTLTGNRMLTGFTAPKWMWLARHEPESIRRTRRIMLPKDYLRLRLTGAAHTDVSDASGTLFFNCEQRKWSSEMCRAIRLPETLLPEVFESATVSARVSADGSRATGLPQGTPVIAGAGDQAAQAVGTGIVREGAVSCTIGTSGVIFAALDAWRSAPEGALHAFCHAAPSRWHLMGVTLSAGGSLRWMRDTLCADLVREAEARGQDPYERMLIDAASAPEGCEGLVFLPYLSGERTPRSDPDARGVFAGLSMRSSRAHMIRAVVEGVTCSLRETLVLARRCSVTVDRVRLSGGGARSAWWRQMLADAFACPTVCVGQTAGAAYGAALLGGVGTGIWRDIDEATALIAEVNHADPGPGAHKFGAIASRYSLCANSLAHWFTHSACQQ